MSTLFDQVSGPPFQHSDRFDILLSNSFLSNLDISNADKLQFHESFKIDIKLTKRSTNLEPNLKEALAALDGNLCFLPSRMLPR